MSKIFKLTTIILIAILLVSGCKKDSEDVTATPTPHPDIVDKDPVTLEPFTFNPETFPRMDGSPGTVPLAQALAAIMLGQSRSETEPLARFSGTTNAYRNLAVDECDILLVGEPYPLLLDEISSQDFRYDMAPIATDALTFIVSTSNPVNNLTSAQAKAIYAGEITNWQQVGGEDLDIIAFRRNEEALSQTLADKLVMDWDKMADAPMQSIYDTAFYDSELSPNAIKGFDGSVNAIGYTMYYYAVNMGMADGYKILSVDGVMPTPDTISSGDYPYTSPYYAVINRDLPEDDNTRILYNWLLSDDGQAFISSEGYVSVHDTAEYSSDTGAESSLMGWSVVTDSSNLTPYNSPRSMSARLYDAALPELIAFDGYGQLLKYSTAVTMNDGSIHAVKYGFVAAQSGTIITDAVYDSLDRATIDGKPIDAYRLRISLPSDDPDIEEITVFAACADDGSWITPFSYRNIVFRDDVMFLIRTADTFDIDVYDYNGNRLYNILELEWAQQINDDAWQMITTANEGHAWVLLDSDTYALMDTSTGDITETDFVTAAGMFSGGLAAVEISDANGLWGFVNEDLEIVIPGSYSNQAIFTDNRAIVETPDGAQHVIDDKGQSLFSVAPEFTIARTEGYGYVVHPSVSSEDDFSTYYTYDFKEIRYPSEALPISPESDIRYLRDGWILCMTEDGVWFLRGSEILSLDASVQSIEDILQFGDDYLVIFNQYDADGTGKRTGVMSLDGTVIIPALQEQSITPFYLTEDVPWFAVNVYAGAGSSFDFIGEKYTQAVYTLVNPANSQIHGNPAVRTDLGILSFDAATGLMYVQGTDYFAWLNADGNTFISIPSMAYTFD